jgi:hypothetical protein
MFSRKVDMTSKHTITAKGERAASVLEMKVEAAAR